MKFEEAIEKSIKAFMEGRMPENLNAAKEGGLKYTPEYFDDFAQELKDRAEAPSKSKKEEAEDDI